MAQVWTPCLSEGVQVLVAVVLIKKRMVHKIREGIPWEGAVAGREEGTRTFQKVETRSTRIVHVVSTVTDAFVQITTFGEKLQLYLLNSSSE